MSKRVHEAAKEFGLTSKEVIEIGAQVGIDLPSHMSTLSDADAAAIVAALPGRRPGGQGAAEGQAPEASAAEEEVGHIVWFDKSSGQGEVEFPASRGATKSMPFDLRRTRLADSRYVPIEQGLEVSVTLDESTIKSIRSRGTSAS